MKCVLIFLLMASTAQAASLKKIVKPLAKLSTLTVLAAEFDAVTTYQGLKSGGAYEANPMMRPFARNASIFPVAGASALGVNFLGTRLKKSNHPKLGKAIQIIWIGAHVAAGVSNIRLMNAPRR